MSHLNDPNTRRLATRCVCCGIDLRDATSVETGIGPICRKKHGYTAEITDANRTAANGAIHRAGIAAEDGRPLDVLKVADEIEKLGLVKLASIIRARFIDVKLVEVEADETVWNRDLRREEKTGRRVMVVQVFTPYHPEFSDLLKRSVKSKRPCYGDGLNRAGGRKFSHWEVPRDESRALLGVLAHCYGGKAATGPKGPFKVPTEAEYRALFATPRL